MSETTTIEGHCLCGAVRVEIDSPVQAIEICQCAMCRRWSGSFYTAQTGKEVRVHGEEAASVYRSSDWAERGFCGTCGSNLWYRFLPTGGRSFSAGLFDAAADHVIEREMFVDEGVSWTCVKGDHPRRTGPEVIAEAKAAGFTFG